MRLATILFAVGLALTTVSSVAFAQDSHAEAEARSVFEAGQVAFNAGHYSDALVYFQRSYDLSHRPELLFNIGLCHDRLRDDTAAIEAYERYLAEVPSAANEGEVDGRLEALRRAQARRTLDPSHVAQVADTTSTPAETPTVPQASPAVYETWWFWTIVGVVVVGSAVGIGVAASGDAPLRTGDVGGVIFTLWGT